MVSAFDRRPLPPFKAALPFPRMALVREDAYPAASGGARHTNKASRRSPVRQNRLHVASSDPRIVVHLLSHSANFPSKPQWTFHIKQVPGCNLPWLKQAYRQASALLLPEDRVLFTKGDTSRFPILWVFFFRNVPRLVGERNKGG